MAPASAYALSPSVEEAYRRKCLLLKQRTADVEETNDAVRVRLARLKRQVEKQRIERAFLLEQLAKRTSTNVEDSDGSPSPPPTPKDKPLRTKRGHRKASLTGPGEPGSSFGRAQSPNSDAASNNVDSQTQGNAKSGAKAKDKDGSKEATDKSKSKPSSDGNKKQKTGSDDNDHDGEAGSRKQPATGFALYCAEKRASLAKDGKKSSGKNDEDVDMVDGETEAAAGDEGKTGEEEGAGNVEEELERGWKELSQSERDKFEARVAEERAAEKTAEKAEKTEKAEKEAPGTEDAADKKNGDKANGKVEAKSGTNEEDKEDEGDDKPRSTDRAVKSEEDVEMVDEETAGETPSGQKD